MRVTCIAHTQIDANLMRAVTGGKWEPEEFYDGASALAEFAGRACYQSWSRPNPATATNEGYLGNIIHQAHFSVMEHGSMTFYIEDVSRSLTHELVRHRHLSPSQLSQRFVVVEKDAPPGRVSPYVIPPLYESEFGIGGDFPSDTEAILESVWSLAVESYDRLVAIHMPRLVQAGVDPHRVRKMAREAARSVLPNMTPTAIVMTGNHRSWREFLEKRATIHADAEIAKLAMIIYYQLIEREPNLYLDFAECTQDGRQVLTRTLNNGR